MTTGSSENDMYKSLRTQLGDITLTVQTIMPALKSAMEIVELSSLKGSDQKDMVNKLIKKLIRNTDGISDNDRLFLIEIVDKDIINQTVDLVVDATVGDIKINKKKVTRCCTSFFKVFRYKM